MATKRNTKKTQVKPSRDLGFFSEIKWGESYTSLFLGAVVVVVLLVLAFSFIKSRNFSNQQAGTSSTATMNETANQAFPKTYTVKKGDDLWHIAQNLYGSGYNYVDLANANKLTNPGMLFSGTKLIVPDVKPRMLTVVKTTPTQIVKPITGTSYTIVKGDFLWNIAVRAYGDGYKWVEIARANKLINPNVIHSGNKLILPR